jgi:hypothetical protein
MGKKLVKHKLSATITPKIWEKVGVMLKIFLEQQIF